MPFKLEKTKSKEKIKSNYKSTKMSPKSHRIELELDQNCSRLQ